MVYINAIPMIINNFNFSIQYDFRQQQDLHDLKKAVMNTKDETQTHSIKETIEKVHALQRYALRVFMKIHVS